jgi:hypothetical protein
VRLLEIVNLAIAELLLLEKQNNPHTGTFVDREDK